MKCLIVSGVSHSDEFTTSKVDKIVIDLGDGGLMTLLARKAMFEAAWAKDDAIDTMVFSAEVMTIDYDESLDSISNDEIVWMDPVDLPVKREFGFYALLHVQRDLCFWTAKTSKHGTNLVSSRPLYWSSLES